MRTSDERKLETLYEDLSKQLGIDPNFEEWTPENEANLEEYLMRLRPKVKEYLDNKYNADGIVEIIDVSIAGEYFEVTIQRKDGQQFAFRIKGTDIGENI